MQILVSGSLAYDRIMNFPGYFRDHIMPEKIHNINVSFMVENFDQSFGGNAGNIAYNLAMLNTKPTIIAAAGTDSENYKKRLENVGVDLSKVKIIDNQLTAFANIMTDNGDNQITAFYPGAMTVAHSDLDSFDYSNSEIAVIAPDNPENILNLINIYQKNNVPYIFDPGQQIPSLTPESLQEGIKGAKIFISNDYELSLIVKKTGLTEAEILAQVEILITTLGEKGSIIKTKDQILEIKPAKVEQIIDPTGAGDAYRAGLIKGLIEKWPLEKVGQFAGTVAAYAVETRGTQEHKFELRNVMERYEINFKN